LDAFANWNGREYDFYFSEKDHINGLSGTNSFLLKAEKPGRALKLLYPDFKFQWGGYLDSSGTHYLYQGEPGKPGNRGDGAVYLRNLTNGTTTTVIPPDNKGQYSIPRLYGDEVLYFRNRLMYRVRLDGSNDVRVLDVGTKSVKRSRTSSQIRIRIDPRFAGPLDIPAQFGHCSPDGFSATACHRVFQVDRSKESFFGATLGLEDVAGISCFTRSEPLQLPACAERAKRV